MNNRYDVEQIEKEIVRLHIFFEEWFNGLIGDSEETFSSFSNSMGKTFSIITPSGIQLNREQILEAVHGAHNRRGGTRIWIKNVRITYQAQGHLIALYEEWQADPGEEERGRLSTVMFSTSDTKLVWLHVHETWLP